MNGVNPFGSEYRGWRSMPRWQRGLTGIALIVLLMPAAWLASALIEGTPFPPPWAGQQLLGLLIGVCVAMVALGGLELLIRELKD